MKFVYNITSHRVLGAQVVLSAGASAETWVLQVLQASLWWPKLVTVHIQSDQCCSAFPQLQGFWTDPRLTRFVAVEPSDTVVVHCSHCGQSTERECVNLSLLHWRSRYELEYWHQMPWFDLVTTGATVTAADSRLEVPWENNVVVSNNLPLVRQCEEGLVSMTLLQSYQLHVLPLVRQCVHHRLVDYMIPWPLGPASVGVKQRVVLALKRGPEFQVKRKKTCLSWPRVEREAERFPVVTAWAGCKGVLTLQQFMKSVEQVVAIGPQPQYLFIVNWHGEDAVPGLDWVAPALVENIHGLNGALSVLALKLALGLSASYVLYHGTSLSRAKGVLRKGFKVSSVHSCPGTYYKCDPPYACCCKGMLGPGVYFAGLEKATSNCGRAAGDEHQHTGVVLQCVVEPRQCKVVTPWSPELCKCGCGSRYSDHVAHWYHGQLYNSVFLEDGAGVKRFELCTRRPHLATPTAQQHVRWNDNREVISNTSWFK